MRRILALALLSVGLAQAAGAAARELPPRRAAPISVAGAPRSLVTLVVAVPSEFESSERVRFEVVVTGAVTVLGRLQGEVEPAGAGGRMRPVMLTLRVPSSALVGLLDVADVVFADDAGRSVIVPIILRVPSVRVVALNGLREMRDLAPGDRIELLYRVQNLGNDTEQLRVQLGSSSAWAPRVLGDPVVVLPAYGAAELLVSVRVPSTFSGGSHPLDVSLVRESRVDTTRVATTRTMMRVKERIPIAPGLSVRPYVGVGAASDGTAATAGVRVVGPLGERARLLLDLAAPPSGGGRGVFALSGLGAVRLPVQATVNGVGWSVSAGGASANLGPLAGSFANGSGVSSRVTVKDVEYEALAARPFAGLGASGHLAGFRATHASDRGPISLAVSSLREGTASAGVSARELRAIGAEWTTEAFDGTAITTGLSFRDHSAGRGVGYQARVGREGPDGGITASLLHAPGGVLAFAPATDSWGLNARRRVSDVLTLDLGARRTRDQGAAIRSIEGRGVDIGATYAVSAATSVGVRGNAQSSLVESGLGTAGQFGSRQQGITTNLQTVRGAWRFGGSFRLSQVERVTTLLNGSVAASGSLQRSTGASVSRAIASLGTIGLSSSLVETGRGVGAPPWLWSNSLRWADVRIPVLEESVRLLAEVRTLHSALERPRVGARTELSTILRNGLEVAASLERNPFLVDASGRVGLMGALRVGLTADVLGSVSRSTERAVFEDLDGDGVRDPGERGVPGVAVRFDNFRFQSARDGSFKVPNSLRGRLRVDAATLPSGLVIHPRVAGDTVERRDIPLVPTARVTVELYFVLDDEGRAPRVDLATADVWLRDADGFEWVGRYIGEGRFLFPDVPIGSYTMRTSTARMAEPVRIEEQGLVLRPGENAALRVSVRGRAVRIITPPRQGGRGGSGVRGRGQ